MKWHITDSCMFATYTLPLFCFPLSMAYAVISCVFLQVIYVISGHKRQCSWIQVRPLALPLAFW